jgi:hypothetical protein
MRPSLPLLFLAACGLLFAQQGKQGKQPQRPLLNCGVHGDAEIICGARSPEDLELTPDGKFLIVTQFVGGRGGGAAPGLALFDLAAKTFAPLASRDEPLADWGDAACPGPIGAGLAGHGSSLVKRTNGAWQLFIVNHAGRETVEMYELKPAGAGWEMVWRGCVPAAQPYNDVAALPGGGFIATHPTALQQPGQNVFAGEPTGFVVRWIPGQGETELPGTRTGYPNGVVVSADGRYAYFAAWTRSEVHKYDLRENRDVGMVKLGFMPDNLTWTAKGQLLAAGVKGTQGECPAGSGEPCIQGFGVAAINPANMQAVTVYDSAGKGALIGGVSVALQAGDAVYVGSFQGDRIVKVAWKE